MLRLNRMRVSLFGLTHDRNLCKENRVSGQGVTWVVFVNWKCFMQKITRSAPQHTDQARCVFCYVNCVFSQHSYWTDIKSIFQLWIYSLACRTSQNYILDQSLSYFFIGHPLLLMTNGEVSLAFFVILILNFLFKKVLRSLRDLVLPRNSMLNISWTAKTSI